MRYIAILIFSIMSVAPVAADTFLMRPRGAVPLLDGCPGMSGYPDCHPNRDRANEGRSMAGPVRPGTWYGAPAYPPGTRFYPAYRR